MRNITTFRQWTQVGLMLVNILCYPLPAASQTVSDKHEVRTEITIRSSPDAVWRMLTNVENYPDWHPFIRKIEGKLTPHSKIKVTYLKNDTLERKFSAYIIDYEVKKQWSWGGSLGFIFRAKHYYIIQPVGTDSVRFIQGEYWKGIFGGMYGNKIYRDTAHKFELMNRKLKVELEKNNSFTSY